MDYLLKSSGLIIVFYFCYKLLLQRDTFFQKNRWYFILGIIGAIVLPLVVIPIYITTEPQQQTFAFTEFTNINNTQSVNEHPFNWNQLIMMLYSLGVSIFGVRLLIQLYSLTSLIHRNTKYKVGKYVYVKVKDDISPFSFFNWIVFNPEQFEDKELQQIITHEKVHARQCHSIDMLLMQVVSVILWFNPFIWLYKKVLEQNLEFIADSETQKQTSCEKSYQQLLLKTSIQNHQMAFANNFYNSLIKKRIVMLHKSKSHKRNQFKFLTIIPLLALFLMSFSTKEVYTEVSNSDAQFLISADTDNKDLKAIEKAFYSNEVKLKFSDLVRNNNGDIQRISINTKYPKDKRFIKRMTLNNNLKVDRIEAFNLSLNQKENKIDFAFVGKDAGTHITNGKISFSDKNSLTTYKNSKSNMSSVLNLGDIEVVIISKDMSDAQLEDLKKQFKKHGVTLKFNGIRRNSDNEIMKVTIEASTKNSRAKYVAGNGKPISTIVVKYDSDANNVMISSASNSFHEMRYTSSGGKHVIKTHGKGSNVFVHSDNDDDSHHEIIVERHGKKQKMKRKDKTVHVISDDDTDEIITENVWTNDDIDAFENNSDERGIFISTSGNDPMIFLNGKQITKEEMDALDTDTIESMNVYKGKSAITKYGKKAKDGVIEITSKN